MDSECQTRVIGPTSEKCAHLHTSHFLCLFYFSVILVHFVVICIRYFTFQVVVTSNTSYWHLCGITFSSHRRMTLMLFTLAMASYQNVQILLRLALMLVCDLLVRLQKLWSRWETKLLHERQPLKQVQMFRGTVLQVQELFKYECDTEECSSVFSLHLESSVDIHSL